ncbi:methyltransferase type 11 [Grosmannia clavigera kw1407]|uniref:Methyltransferase type 11 n=1 Tax=Grosmannia clavigera (strain kw1407 / UAMH 11150) TaxID=655863 RepID=F0XBC8_GROCL|nr:methyltransferase type 11 [Grosmannia clavigera kw1407]EFX05074.1 methyltransferase type 11 [Grosmannia clavigera kw1407]
MGSQYDAIGAKYTTVFKTQPASLVEQANFRDAVTPRLRRPDGSGARVLDLACGTGFYSRRLLDWGAASVVGIDLSEGMITAAQQGWPAEDKRLQFQVGDAQRLGAVFDEGQPFDLVTGAWLLNYAASLDDMTAMFASIAANLGEGGVFVSVTPHATDDIDAFAKMASDFESEKPENWGVAVNYYERLASGAGWKTEIVGSPTGSEAAAIRFCNYHLRKSIYEEAARRGGMKGKLTWRPVRLPDEVVAATGPEVWELYFSKGLHFGLLEVEK